MQSYGVVNMSTWTENIRDLKKKTTSRVTVHGSQICTQNEVGRVPRRSSSLEKREGPGRSLGATTAGRARRRGRDGGGGRLGGDGAEAAVRRR